ncbi:hypothetical protein [Altericista sp. CCNU0014]|uniref:hypothetical protein n=1 Tax=Altericista sp. CCNU0014 TaxID=3082949 RepID=UPI003850C039
MFCPSCNGQIYPFAKDFVCPHCFVQLKVHSLKRLTVFLLPDNRLAGIYNANSGRVVSFMGFIANPPIEQKAHDRQVAISSRRLQVCLNQISDTLKVLEQERQTLLDSEVVVERVLTRTSGIQQQSSLCRSQIALAYGLLEKLEEAYTKLRVDLELAVTQPPQNAGLFKTQIQQQVKLVRQLESLKESALRSIH